MVVWHNVTCLPAWQRLACGRQATFLCSTSWMPCLAVAYNLLSSLSCLLSLPHCLLYSSPSFLLPPPPHHCSPSLLYLCLYRTIHLVVHGSCSPPPHPTMDGTGRVHMAYLPPSVRAPHHALRAYLPPSTRARFTGGGRAPDWFGGGRHFCHRALLFFCALARAR